MVRLHQLDPVAERVVHVNPVVALKRFVAPYRMAGPFKRGCQSCEVLDQEGRVCLAGGLEVGFHTEMQLEPDLLEPAAAPAGKVGRRASCF